MHLKAKFSGNMRGTIAATDELFDAYVSRPLAAYIVRAVQFTSITPNHLTLASMFFGVCAAGFIVLGTSFSPIAGSLCLILSMIFDCSDGQLARARGGGSILGRIYDGYADYVTGIALHISLMFALAMTEIVIWGYTPDTPVRIMLVVAAGISTVINAGRFDFYKQHYFAHTDATKVLEKPEIYLQAAERAHAWFEKISLRLFAAYLKTNTTIEKTQKSAVAHQIAKDPALREKFIAENQIWLRLWSFSGPTMHNVLLSVAGIITLYVPQAFFWYCVFVVGPVNLYCLIIAIAQRISRK